jgi:anaerobic magnesium-protoporphyrin IX monomethyl ester cyclase
MRILLIAPPIIRMKYNIGGGVYPLPPLGLAYIASVLEQHGFGVDILDMPILRTGIKDLHRLLKKNQYDVYGLSCTIFNLSEGIKIAGLIKDINPNSRFVLGGHCNVFSPELIFKYGADFDIIVRGEGEEVMLNLCNQLNNGACPDLYKIKGISFQDGRRVVNTSNAPYLNLDTLPFPARHLLPHRLYKMYPPFNLFPPVTLIETSRGCMHNCTFCSISQSARERAIENVIEEIKEVTGKFKVRGVRFVDSNFVHNAERISHLCDRILEEHIKLAWTCETRIKAIPEDVLKKMSAAGCYMIAYGVESGSKKILDLLNKGITAEEIMNTFRLTRKAGIKTIAYLMLGLPEEDSSSFRETLRLVKKIEPDFVLYTELFPIPGSPLTKKLMKSGQITEERLAEYYILHKDIFRKRSFGGYPRNKIKQRQFLATLRFYFDIRFIMRRLKEVRNLQELFYLVKGVYFFLLDLMDFRLKYALKG